MNRRRFLEGCSSGLVALYAASPHGHAARAGSSSPPREVAADLVIVGGGLGGCAAALAALENNLKVILTESTDWIGGQLTAQAVPPDEHQWIEQLGRNARYQKLRQGIRDYYRRHYPLTAEAQAETFLNPGRGGVSRLCHEPRVALAVLTAMLAPYSSGGRLLVLLEHEPIEAEVEADRVRAVVVRDRKTKARRVLIAPYFLDATELGDLLPLAEVEFVTAPRARTRPASHTPRPGPVPTFSKRSPAVSRWIISTARITLSSGRQNTTSGEVMSRSSIIPGRESCLP